MKKLFTILTIIATILIGCSKEDLNPTTNNHSNTIDSLQHIQDSLSKLTPCGVVVNYMNGGVLLRNLNSGNLLSANENIWCDRCITGPGTVMCLPESVGIKGW